MFGKLYLRLYFWFLLVFFITLLTVWLITSHFYGNSIHDEIENHLTSQARFLLTEYQNACGDSSRLGECRRFFGRISRTPFLRLWILDPEGKVRMTQQRSQPPLNRDQIQRAAAGETLILLHGMPPTVVLPVKDSDGKVAELLVMGRPLLGGRRLSRFPLIAVLAMIGLMIALLVLPLSRRLTRPLRALHLLGEEWAEGRLEKRATVTGNDEISALSRVFNTMAENLQKMLQQRKEFLALISHELKSPLTRMKIAAELISEQEPSAVKLVNDIKTDIEASEALVEQLLCLSRIEMGLPSAIKETVDLNQVIQRSIARVEPVARASGISIRYSGESHSINGDSAELQRAIVNVLENAVKFSAPQNEVELEMRRQDSVVRIVCKDHGPGIESEEQQKIFEPFYRGKRTDGKDGSGLGLFIARRIAEMHGGKIWAEPNQPSGTILTLELPA